MRLLFVADGHSPIAQNWIKCFVEQGHEVHLVTSYPCSVEFPLASLHVLTLAIRSLDASEASSWRRSFIGPLVRKFASASVRMLIRQWVVLPTIPKASAHLSALIEQIAPQIVHAMRIPFEGMVTAVALKKIKMAFHIPFLVSVWGNDFTLHASSTPWMRKYTHLTVKSADALHADCYRDLRLASHWGFRKGLPSIVLPGGGGVRRDVFYPAEEAQGERFLPTIINPRGLRAYVRNDVFFQAIPLILERFPKARFLCPGMAGEPYAQHWVRRLNIACNVELLPTVRYAQMADLFRRSLITVSPSSHDGTPNTLLEAMACGCFPIAGDLESLREWIIPGENGLLVHPLNGKSLAQAILTAVEDHDLLKRAREQNIRLIAERADYGRVMAQAERFYHKLIE